MIRLSFPRSITLTLLSALSLQALAQAPADNPATSSLQDEIQWLQEETHVFTATKTKEHIKKSGSSVSVITAKELVSSGARNLMDALKRVPGFDIQTTSIGIPAISVRGVKTDSSEKVLFMINGHSVNNNLVNGGATWAYRNFQIDEIKRVEIVRGPGSALYGTNAFVAIINIVTFTADDIERPKLAIGVGSHHRKTLNLSTGHKNDHWQYALNLNLHDSEGMKEFVAQDGAGNSGSTIDWEKRYDLGFNASFDRFAINGKIVQREAGPYVGIGNALNDESKQDYLEYFIELTYKEDLNKHLSVSAKAYHDHFQADNFWEIFSENFPGFGSGAFPDGAIGSPTVKNEKYGTELQAILKTNIGHKLLGGISFEHQTQFHVRHLTNFDPVTFTPQASYQNVSSNWNWNENHSRDISAIYLQDIWDLNEDLRLIVGARNDYYSDFGNTLNPRSSLTWQASPDMYLTLLYGQAFRAPNFGELYNINTPVIKGNPELDAEEIETFEASLDIQLSKRESLKISAFKNDIQNIIGYVGGVASNNGKLETTGLEMQFDSRLSDGSSFDVNYTYQYPRNKSDNSRAADIPLHQANASYTHRYSRYLNAYLGSRYRGALGRAAGDARNDVKEQITVDLAINWRDTKDQLSVSASIYNIFNERQHDAAALTPSDFPTEGRTFALNTTLAL